MESVCVGAFILFLFLAAIIIASPISMVIGAIAYSVRKNDQRRIQNAVVAAIVAFVFLVVVACIGFMIWNPQI
jgi:small neutral amino acid transporter SnatA (MarC family)